MTTAATPLPPPTQPLTSDGKRNWAWSAVHPGQPHLDAQQTAAASEGSFWDLLDIINPLQHIPILGSLYRAATGDTVSAPARILGGLLFGGPAGFLTGVAGTLLAETTGGDAGEHILAALGAGNSSQVNASNQYLQAAALGNIKSSGNVIKI